MCSVRGLCAVLGGYVQYKAAMCSVRGLCAVLGGYVQY